MAHRVNTRNFENGEQMTVNWRKTFDRHWQFSSKAEMLEAYGNVAAAKKEIERRFSPFLINEHLYLNLECGKKQVCIGYIDAQDEKGYYMISLNSDFGEDCECCHTKKRSIERLYEIYKSVSS